LNAHSVGIAVIALAIGFVLFCLVDLVRAEKVRYLPKWAWAILCLGIGLTIPFGGILYLLAGRDRRPKPRPASG
jgi:Phospholipase_D-nuclease N-terminal